MIRVVLDTNVLVSALISRKGAPAQVLDLIENEGVALILSEEIFSEYDAVLAREKFSSLPRVKVLKLLKRLRVLSENVKPAVIPRTSPDPADDKFLAASLSGEADYLVTGNLKHFPKTFRGARILSPNQFLDAAMQDVLKRLH